MPAPFVVEGSAVVVLSLSSRTSGGLPLVGLVVDIADVVDVGLGVVTMETPAAAPLVVGGSPVVVVKPLSEDFDWLPFVVLVGPVSASTVGYTIVAAVVARTTKRIHASLCTGGDERRQGLAVPGVIACRPWSGMSSGEGSP